MRSVRDLPALRAVALRSRLSVGALAADYFFLGSTSNLGGRRSIFGPSSAAGFSTGVEVFVRRAMRTRVSPPPKRSSMPPPPGFGRLRSTGFGAALGGALGGAGVGATAWVGFGGDGLGFGDRGFDDSGFGDWGFGARGCGAGCSD